MPEEDVIKRVMPHSLEAEQSVLGAMIMDRDAVEAASEVLTADDFYSKQNGLIYEAIVELTADNTEVDEVTLQNRLREKGLPPEFCTTEYIESLVAMVPTSANVRSYVKIVEDKSMLRKLIRAGESIANNCYEGKEDLDTIMDDAEKRVFDLSQRRGISDYTPIRQIVLNAVAKIQEASKTKSKRQDLPWARRHLH